MPVQRVKEAIEAIKNGEMVIMMDDEDRENEGDLVYAATFSTPEKVNFLASEAKGLICVALSKEISNRLELTPMVEKNSSQHETAFTVTVDDVECTTGISAFERDMTIQRLANPLAKASDLVRPGHIFPLIAKDGGVLIRTGHTEGSVDLCKLAGITPVAAICEIMKSDGNMARRDDLLEFAKKHNMKIIYISDLVEYRLRYENLMNVISEEESLFLGETCKKSSIKDHLGNVHTVFSFKDASDGCAVKFHSIAKDIDTFCDSHKYNTLIASLEVLKKEPGLLIFLDNSYVNSDVVKDFGTGAQILRLMGIKNFKLITSKQNREYVGLGGFGLTISEQIQIEE